jgi:[acyl-carrier-protein] S-malonyltransferase
MGHDLAEAYPLARDLFAQADDLTGFPLSQICFFGPLDTLTETAHAQPAILTVSLICHRILEDRFPDLSPAMLAGHSLGEYSALVAAGALSFNEALSLVCERGRLMAEVGRRTPGVMAAILGLSEEAVQEICQEATEAGGIIQMANINAPGQTVISGDREGLKRATDLALAQWGTKVIPLAVSAASHSPLMEAMTEAFRDEVRRVRLQPPLVPVVGNTTAQPLSEASEIRLEMEHQLTSSVRWVESIKYMMGEGITTFVEVGPGNVLRGLLRRIDRRVRAISVGDKQSIEALMQDIKGGGL